MFDIQKSVVLVGLGKIGLTYDLKDAIILESQTMTHCKALAESEYFKLTGVVDISSNARMLASKIFGVVTFKNLHECISRIHPEVLVIATPTFNHLEIIQSIPTDKMPEILVLEKPAGRNAEECILIEEWAKYNNVEVFVNYFRRYLSNTLIAKETISNLNLGKLLEIKIQAYGTLQNIFSHFLDLIAQLVGKSSLCLCSKKAIDFETHFVSYCKNCDLQYSFSGLGLLSAECKVFLRFENYDISVLKSGRIIKISNTLTNQFFLFEIDINDYKNYQKIVYTFLGSRTNNAIDSELNGLEQAFRVHKFIESVDFGYVK